MQKLTYAFADGVAIAKRNVIKIKREYLKFSCPC